MKHTILLMLAVAGCQQPLVPDASVVDDAGVMLMVPVDSGTSDAGVIDAGKTEHTIVLGGDVARQVAAGFYTQRTSVTLPDNFLSTGDHYYAVVDAIRDSDNRVVERPFGRGRHTAVSSALTNFFVP